MFSNMWTSNRPLSTKKSLEEMDLLNLELSIIFPPPKEGALNMRSKGRDMRHNRCKYLINEKFEENNEL